MMKIVISKVADCSGFYTLFFHKNEFGIVSKNYPKEIFNGHKPKRGDVIDIELKDSKLMLSFNGVILGEK